MWSLRNLFAPKWTNLEQRHNNRIITMSEVSLHDSMNDCWIVLFNVVYDITNFLTLIVYQVHLFNVKNIIKSWNHVLKLIQHPGGLEVLVENGGRDATIAFQEAGHADVSLSLMESYRIGRLPENEELNLDLVLGNNWKTGLTA
ncbi:cytochrome b5-like [Cimex lectularius]|uniref:Cytochrome b5 heme-binding domain-containing protein n=1 Tax=Cimex lectularius TaxID=79782 RepID=A0A8I6TK71_CIMLE|nr:cytochrome b5-like [Cimex lectularius]